MKIDKYYNTCLEFPFTNIPYSISKEKYVEIKSASEGVNLLCLRVLNELKTTFSDYQIKDFPLSNRIFSLKAPISPLLWTRFDTFLKEEDDGVFFAEFNYDKPCAERELMEMELECKATNNINKGFTQHLQTAIKQIGYSFKQTEKINIGFLTSATKYEETCLGYLIKDLVSDKNYNVTVVGVNNLFVEDDTLYAFDKSNSIDVLIRLFPTEYLYEVSNIEAILDLFDNGKILIVNDPRIIAIQCKSLFAYLWSLVLLNDNRLSVSEKELIKTYIPYTTISKPHDILSNKNRYLIKPIYGRYSQNIFIGMYCTDEEWREHCKNIEGYIVQEFFKTHMFKVPCKEGKFTSQYTAYGNFGSFLIGSGLAGLCTRWSTQCITTEDTTWITPLVIKENPLEVHESGVPFDVLYLKSIKQFGFAGGYTKDFRYLSTEYLTLSSEKYQELVYATECLCEIFSKVQNLIKSNLSLFADILSISEFTDVIEKSQSIGIYSFLGRLDFVLDLDNNLKVLEINSETPAGICESTGIDNLVYSQAKWHSKGYERINTNLESALLTTLDNLPSHVKTIACVGTNYYEDVYTYNTVRDILAKDPLYNVISGSIYDIKVIKGVATLYGEKIDAIYRYFPLEWIYTDTELSDLKDLIVNNKLIMLNSAESIISQSKGFFAVIWELLNSNFFSNEEREVVEKYIPFTTFNLDAVIERTSDFFIKPLLEREGAGIVHSMNVMEVPKYDCVFQEQVLIRPVNVTTWDYKGSQKQELFPILGVYTVNKSFRGMYTRLGDLITTNKCIYLPTFKENEEEE